MSLNVHGTFRRCPVVIDRIRFGKSAECYCRNEVASQSTALFDYGSARMTLALLYPFRIDLSCSWRAEPTAWAFHVASSHLKGALISLWRLGDLTREFSHLMSLQDVACRSSHVKVSSSSVEEKLLEAVGNLFLGFIDVYLHPIGYPWRSVSWRENNVSCCATITHQHIR